MQAFLINLARRPDRLRAMTQQLDGLGVAFQRIEAVDAKSPAAANIERSFARTGPLGPFSKGDKSCTMSHIRAWLAFLASGEEFGVILEDDVLLDRSAASFLRNPDWIPSSARLIKLEHYGPDSQRVLVGDPTPVTPRRYVAQLHSRHVGAAAYIISRDAASMLLSSIERWAVPVDHMLFNPNSSPAFAALRPLQLVSPFGRQTAPFGGHSDIGEWRSRLCPSAWTYIQRVVLRAYSELRLIPLQIASVLSLDTRLVRVSATAQGNRIPQRTARASMPEVGFGA